LATEEVAKYEAEHEALGDIDHWTAEKEDLQAKMKVNKLKLTEIKVRLTRGSLLYRTR
jgi:hypothetical protein